MLNLNPMKNCLMKAFGGLISILRLVQPSLEIGRRRCIELGSDVSMIAGLTAHFFLLTRSASGSA